MAQETKLDLAACAGVLGLPLERLKTAVRERQFPDPVGHEDGQPYWLDAQAYGWALSAAPEAAGRVPLWWWPDADEPAAFTGPRDIGDGDVALGWEVPGLGEVFMAWPSHDTLGGSDRIVSGLRDAAGIVVVESDFSAIGPSVRGILPSAPGVQEYPMLDWPRVAKVIGAPLPYWPFALRIPALIRAWKPGAPPVTAPAIPDMDVAPLLRLAAAVEDGSPAQRVLVNLVRITQHRETESAARNLQTLAKWTDASTVTVAARPMAVPDADDLDLGTRRAGWLEILARDDTLAAACIREKMMWDHGADFPFGNAETVNPDESPLAAEWAGRLIPAPRTAAFDQLDPHQAAAETLTDPETDAPVIRHRDGTLLAAVPQRLPATAPLAELILDRPVWVRTADGTLYLAPKDAYWGLSWGYGGSGPGALAVLASRLLADINTAPADNPSDAPEGLHDLMQQPWPAGTVLTRARLQAARDNRPWPRQ